MHKFHNLSFTVSTTSWNTIFVGQKTVGPETVSLDD